jgi:hypothetical protein
MSDGLLLLTPSSAALSPWPGAAEPPLGAALVVQLSRLEAIHAEVAGAVRACPWCPVVLIADCARLDRELLGLVLSAAPRNPAIVPATGVKQHSPELLRAAIRGRTPVTGEDLVAYLARRALGRSLVTEVAVALAVDPDTLPDGPPPPAAAGTYLHPSGALNASDWRAVSRLLAATERNPPGWESGVDPRILELRSRRYLGLGIDDLAGAPGWEWKLEAVLRRFGYVVDPGASGDGGMDTSRLARGA